MSDRPSIPIPAKPVVASGSVGINTPSLLPTAATTHYAETTATTVTPGTEQTLISEAVPGGTTRYLTLVKVPFRHQGFFEITAGGSRIGSGHTGPGRPDPHFAFDPPRPISGGTTVEVKFTAQSGVPSTACVDAYLMGGDST